MHHLLERSDRLTRIHMIDENVTGWLVQENAYFSRVKYDYLGHHYEIDVLNDEFIVVEQIGYESD